MPASNTTGGAAGSKLTPAGSTARCDRIELALQQAAQHHDPLVAGRQMLVGMQGDRALPDLRLPVARELLMFFRREVRPELAVHARALGAQFAFAPDLAGHVDAEMGVIDRQGPTERFDADIALDPGIGHDPERGQRRLGDAVVDASVFEHARGDRLDAGRRIFPPYLGHDAHLRHELHAAERAMQNGDVERIRHVFIMLKPVAGHDRTAA